jgi:hypothetical protein
MLARESDTAGASQSPHRDEKSRFDTKKHERKHSLAMSRLRTWKINVYLFSGSIKNDFLGCTRQLLLLALDEFTQDDSGSSKK